MDRWAGKVAIVTGASSGIGSAIVEALARSGVTVVGLARRVEKVSELAKNLKEAKGQIYPIKCDVQKDEDILKAFQWIEKTLGGVDILINNAGVASKTPIIESPTETLRNILEVNVLAVAIMAREAIKSMRKRAVAGHIIFMNSVLGHNADLTSSASNLYSASKYAVTAMTSSLRNEITAAELNIKITSISPGLVDTEMLAIVGLPKEIRESPMCIKVKDISDAVIYALSTGPNVQIKELTITPLVRDLSLLK